MNLNKKKRESGLRKHSCGRVQSFVCCFWPLFQINVIKVGAYQQVHSLLLGGERKIAISNIYSVIQFSYFTAILIISRRDTSLSNTFLKKLLSLNFCEEFCQLRRYLGLFFRKDTWRVKICLTNLILLYIPHQRVIGIILGLFGNTISTFLLSLHVFKVSKEYYSHVIKIY